MEIQVEVPDSVQIDMGTRYYYTPNFEITDNIYDLHTFFVCPSKVDRHDSMGQHHISQNLGFVATTNTPKASLFETFLSFFGLQL